MFKFAEEFVRKRQQGSLYGSVIFVQHLYKRDISQRKEVKMKQLLQNSF